MRVISQDGSIDYPYDKSVVFLDAYNENNVEIQLAGDKECLILGNYSTKEKALKAMELLREKYGKLKVMKVIANGTAEYMEKSLSTDEMIEQYNAYCDMNTFQFPQDDEIEV